MIDPIEALQGIVIAMGCFLVMGAAAMKSLELRAKGSDELVELLRADQAESRERANHWKKQADLWERAYKFGRTVKVEATPGATLSQAEIKQLISLCHPDRHGGKQAAVQMTQRLLQMRGN